MMHITTSMCILLHRCNGTRPHCCMSDTHLVVRRWSRVEPTKITEFEKWHWIPIDFLVQDACMRVQLLCPELWRCSARKKCDGKFEWNKNQTILQKWRCAEMRSRTTISAHCILNVFDWFYRFTKKTELRQASRTEQRHRYRRSLDADSSTITSNNGHNLAATNK